MARIPFLALCLIVGAANAEQYWFSFDGSDFPENQGWERVVHAGGAERSIVDGKLIIDSRRSIEISDSYRRRLGGNLDPEMGEHFVARWRLLTEHLTGLADPGIGVFSDERYALILAIGEDELFSILEPGVSVSFRPGVFHEFELRSFDMREYVLMIDGVPQLSGTFNLVVQSSTANWGDIVQGGASYSTWDYFEFGVVPEPAVGGIVATLTLLVIHFSDHRRQRCGTH